MLCLDMIDLIIDSYSIKEILNQVQDDSLSIEPKPLTVILNLVQDLPKPTIPQQLSSYLTTTSSTNIQALPPAPACQSGHFLIFVAITLTYRALTFEATVKA